MLPNNIITNLLTVVAADDGITQEQWQLIRELAGAQINPETARVFKVYKKDLPTDRDWPGKNYYVRPLGSDELVHFMDLPEDIRDALIEMYPNL